MGSHGAPILKSGQKLHISEVAEIFIRGALSIVKLVDEGKNPKYIYGLHTLSSKITTPDSQNNKRQKAKI